MSPASPDRLLRPTATAASALTAGLMAAAAVMVVSAVGAAFRPASTVLTGTYVGSTVVMIALLWVRSVRVA